MLVRNERIEIVTVGNCCSISSVSTQMENNEDKVSDLASRRRVDHKSLALGLAGEVQRAKRPDCCQMQQRVEYHERGRSGRQRYRLTEGYCAAIGYGSSAAVTPIFAFFARSIERSQGANYTTCSAFFVFPPLSTLSSFCAYLASIFCRLLRYP